MRRSVRSIVNAFSSLPYLLGVMALASEPTRDEANMPLTAVSKRESFVFASTPNGLFRASLETKRWERLKTPPQMPLNGTFAAQPGRSPVVIYVATRSTFNANNERPRPDSRYGLYVTKDNGLTWELVSERDDFGVTLLNPNGVLFAVTGDDEIGQKVVRSTDLGKTWRDITGTASGQFMGLSPDPDHPGLIQIHAWGLREYTFVADDENYQWRSVHGRPPVAGRRPSNDFFSRDSSTTNRFHRYPATLSNYFQYDFGDQVSVQALEVLPEKTRFEFARGARIVVPVRVVFHFDADTALADPQHPAAKGRPIPKPTPPAEKFADGPDGTDFWGLRVESAGDQIEKYPAGRRVGTTSFESTADGKTVTSTRQPPAVKYRVVDLSPSSPYAREIDLGRLSDFSKLGEYRVQIIYDSGGHAEQDESVWDGHFTSPVFTVIIRE